jgi:hypothetical protein
MFIKDIAYPAGLGDSFTPPSGTWTLTGNLVVTGTIKPSTLTKKGVVYIDGTTGVLATDYDGVSTGFYYDLAHKAVYSDNGFTAYDPTSGDNAVFFRAGTGGSGDPVDDNHGIKFGIHWTGAGGDQPGANYGVLPFAYFAGPIRVGVSAAYRFCFQVNDNTEAGHAYFSPDDEAGDGSKDNAYDLGRFTLAGTGGEGYTRRQRFRDIYLGTAVRWGNKNLAVSPMISTSGTTVQIKLADDSAFAPLKVSTLTATGAINVSNTGIVGIAGQTGIALTSQLAIGDANTDAYVNSSVTRTAGQLFEVYNNSSLRFRVGPSGVCTIPNSGSTLGIAGNMLIAGNEVQVTASDSSLLLVGNRNAGSTGTPDVQIAATTNRSAGNIVGVYVNGTSGTQLWYVGWDGRMYVTTPASAPTDGDLKASSISMYLDEVGNNLKVRVKYANGTTLKTATIALV